jgi:PAS domain S-box-containing protein
VVATDLTGIVTYWNRSAELLYGWSAAEVIGRDVKEINLWPMPSDGAAPLLDDYTSSTAWSGEVTVRHQDGGTLLALVTHNPILDTEGVVAGRVSVALDISELRPVVDAGSGGEVHGSGMLLDVTERYPSEELP